MLSLCVVIWYLHQTFLKLLYCIALAMQYIDITWLTFGVGHFIQNFVSQVRSLMWIQISSLDAPQTSMYAPHISEIKQWGCMPQKIISFSRALRSFFILWPNTSLSSRSPAYKSSTVCEASISLDGELLQFSILLECLLQTQIN